MAVLVDDVKLTAYKVASGINSSMSPKGAEVILRKCTGKRWTLLKELATMSLSNEELDRIAREAERDLNTYRAKVGTGSKPGYDECGVNTDIDSRFPGAHVELNTSGRGDKRRIPVEEGGEVDARGRYVPQSRQDF